MTTNDVNETTVARYRYNGLGYRISSYPESESTTFCFCYDERWRIVATFRGSDSDPKERFVYHASGLDGMGTSSYIDGTVLRDRDNNTAWTSAADGTLEQRRFLCQNWRADVSAVVTSGGVLAECMKYSSYGVPFGLPGGDTDSDGDWDATDAGNIGGGYTVLEDVDLDGDVDASDATAANGAKSGYYATGRGVLSAISIRKGYAGYELASELLGTKWHVRHRVLDSELGRWTRRDPLGYTVYLNAYHYADAPHNITDPSGLDTFPCQLWKEYIYPPGALPYTQWWPGPTASSWGSFGPTLIAPGHQLTMDWRGFLAVQPKSAYAGIDASANIIQKLRWYAFGTWMTLEPALESSTRMNWVIGPCGTGAPGITPLAPGFVLNQSSDIYGSLATAVSWQTYKADWFNPGDELLRVLEVKYYVGYVFTKQIATATVNGSASVGRGWTLSGTLSYEGISYGTGPIIRQRVMAAKWFCDCPLE